MPATSNSTTARSKPRPAPTPAPKKIQACRHCNGRGLEPLPFQIEISQSGPKRGQLADLSKETGISDSMLSMIFSGERTPSLATLRKLSEALGVTADRLMAYPPIAERISREPLE